MRRQLRCPKGPSTLATLFNHMWPRIVAGIFIPVGNHYFQALASTLQFVAQVCDRLWLVPATDRAFAYMTYMSPPHVALVCSGPPQNAATCGWTKWPVCSGPKIFTCDVVPQGVLLGPRSGCGGDEGDQVAGGVGLHEVHFGWGGNNGGPGAVGRGRAHLKEDSGRGGFLGTTVVPNFHLRERKCF